MLDIDEDDEEVEGKDNKSKGGNIQWGKEGDWFHSVGETFKRLEPAVYLIHCDMRQTAMFAKQELPKERAEFDNPKADEIMERIDAFWASRDEYKRWNVPHRTGVILHGVPGAGKTKLMHQVAEKHVAGGGYVFIHSHNVHVMKLCTEALREIHPESRILVLMEDLHESVGPGNVSNLTAVLDGTYSADCRNIAFLASTNYLKQLPVEVRKRPSRFDLIVEMGPPPLEVREGFLVSMAQGTPLPFDLKRIVRDTAGFTFAHLMELFTATVILKMPPSDVIARLREMLVEEKEVKGRKKRKKAMARMTGYDDEDEEDEDDD